MEPPSSGPVSFLLKWIRLVQKNIDSYCQLFLQEDFSLDMDFSKTKKKKKKKKDLDELVGEELEKRQQEIRDEGNYMLLLFCVLNYCFAMN